MSQKSSAELRYVVIGAGMAGMLAAIELLESGHRNLVVYEKGETVGGTWRENTYPGLTCDVPSHSYTYSFELNPNWTRTLPPGSEVQAYFEGVKEKYGLNDWIQFNQEIVRCQYKDGQWHIETASGDKDFGDVIIAATGVLHHPRYPVIEGMDSFEGAIFHSARWDHSVPLDGTKIAVIGTGSTGVQIVSTLATRASELTHFQRSPQWILPVEDRPFTEEERESFRNDPEALRAKHYDDEIEAGIERFSAAITDPESSAMQEIDQLVLSNLEESVTDEELKEKIRPHYRPACKRLIYSSNFYEAIQRQSVEAVVEDVTKIEPKGIRTADGALHEYDVIVLATGFQADRFLRPTEVVGRDGVRLADVWDQKPSAYLSVSIPEFPNLFMLNGPNGPVGNFSLIEIAECQWGYIEQLIEKLENGVCREISASQVAADEFEVVRVAQAKKTIFATGCDSWYLDQQGVPATWPWTRSEFKEAMSKPDFDCFDMVG